MRKEKAKNSFEKKELVFIHSGDKDREIKRDKLLFDFLFLLVAVNFLRWRLIIINWYRGNDVQYNL